METDANETIRRLEEARADALIKADRDALAALLSNDLVHVHANGLVENKSQYLDTTMTKLDFLEVNRVSLQIRLYGGFAVGTGELHQTVRMKESGTILKMKVTTTQTWIQQDDDWLQNTFHATSLG